MRVAALYDVDIRPPHVLELVNDTSTGFQVAEVVSQEYGTEPWVKARFGNGHDRRERIVRDHEIIYDIQMKRAVNPYTTSIAPVHLCNGCNLYVTSMNLSIVYKDTICAIMRFTRSDQPKASAQMKYVFRQRIMLYGYDATPLSMQPIF